MAAIRYLVSMVGVCGCPAMKSSSSSSSSSPSTVPAGGNAESASSDATASSGEASDTPVVAHFDAKAYYAITTVVDGKELALTLVLGGNERNKTGTSAKNRIELRPLTKQPTQLWMPKAVDSEYLLFVKVSDHDYAPSAILKIYNQDNEFSDDENGNRVTVGQHSNETIEYWHLLPAGGGKFRIRSLVGDPKSTSSDKWSEPRVLEAVDVVGQVKVRHAKVRDVASQYWTFTRE